MMKSTRISAGRTLTIVIGASAVRGLAKDGDWIDAANRQPFVDSDASFCGRIADERAGVAPDRSPACDARPCDREKDQNRGGDCDQRQRLARRFDWRASG